MPFSKGDPNINRKGRPRKVFCLSDILREILDVKDVKKGYEEITRKKALMEILIQQGLRGDLKAIDMIFDRIEGKPLQQVEAEVYNSPVPIINIITEPEDE